MLGLIYKDILLGRLWVCFFALASIIGMSLSLFELPPIFMLIIYFAICIFASLLPEMSMTADTISKWNIYATCTSTARKKTVLAKFLLICLCYLSAFAVCMIYMFLNKRSDMEMLIVLISLMSSSDFISFSFIFRFGVKKGSAYKLMLLILIPLAVIIYLLFGDLSVFASGEFDLESFDMNKFIGNNYIYFLMGAALVFALTYLISVKVYRKGIEYGEGV